MTTSEAGGPVGVGLLVAAYTQERAAEAVQDALAQAGSDAGAMFGDSALVRRDAEGRVHISESGDMSTGAGAGIGALIGGVIGLLGGPQGMVVGAGVGAAIGGLAAHADTGFDNESLEVLGAALPPGTSALVVTTSQSFIETVREQATEGENLVAAAQIAGAIGGRLAARQDVLMAMLITESGVSANTVLSAPDELAMFEITATDEGVSARGGVATTQGVAIADAAILDDASPVDAADAESGAPEQSRKTDHTDSQASTD